MRATKGTSVKKKCGKYVDGEVNMCENKYIYLYTYMKMPKENYHVVQII